MKAMPLSPKNQDGSCPACGAPLTQCEGRRSKKVQCPKCRKIIILGGKDPMEAPGPGFEVFVTRELAELKARLAQLAPLQNRIAEIERELARARLTAPAPPPSPDVRPSRPSQRSIDVLEVVAAPKPSPLIADAEYGLSPETETRLEASLHPPGGSPIDFLFAEENSAAESAATRLRKIFSHAGWVTQEPRATGHLMAGLALAAGTGRLSAQVAAIHRAFAGGGVVLAFQIDPGIADDRLVLSVGPPAGAVV